jgi:hypothetical protein
VVQARVAQMDETLCAMRCPLLLLAPTPPGQPVGSDENDGESA